MVDGDKSTFLTKYHILRNVVFGVLVAVVGWYLVLLPTIVWFKSNNSAYSPLIEAGPVERNGAAPESLPVTLRVPTMGLEVGFTNPLGVRENGEIEVPAVYDKVGWYKYSPAPGQIGPMIILGHVDSYTGPAVFFSLGSLQAGDDIFVTGDDGVERQYKVDRSEKYDQDEFPAELVYGNTTNPELRLITCSGVFDKINQRYSHNRVVYATLISS